MKKISLALFAIGLTSVTTSASAMCWDIHLSHKTFESKVKQVIDHQKTGLALPGWATIVDETGMVCRVVSTGRKGIKAGNDQWLGSRVISAQKANTANAFSLDGLSISTGALYAATQPGASLYGLQHSNPVDAKTAYSANPWGYGTHWDQLTYKRIGGVNVFGGGLALYQNGKKIGAIGVSGDTSCTDHANAWKIRKLLHMEPSSKVAQVEMLKMATVYADLGDHPSCPNSSALVGDASSGFN